MKIKRSLVPFASALMTWMSPLHGVVVSTFSVDMLGEFQLDTLIATDVAGVVPAAQWLPALGLTGGTSGVASGGIGGTIFVGWDAPQSAIIPGSSSAAGDEDMMEGFVRGIQNADGTFQPAVVQVGTLNLPALNWDYYDVYVYSDQGTSTVPAPNSLALVLSPGTATIYTHLETGTGYGAGAPGYLNSQIDPAGNYVRYSGLTAPTFSLFAQPGAGSASAAINGFQIVGHQAIPKPAIGMAVIFGGLLLVFRRKRTVKQR